MSRPIAAAAPLRNTAFYLLALALLLSLVAWIYWPGIQGPELLDDRSSVMVITDLQSQPERAWDFVFGDSSGTLGRSLSMATFVLEKLYLDEGIAGNKRINILLHLLNGVLVIWLFALLLDAKQVTGHRWLALVLGAVWLLHPLQVSTVLYVVQRMAMLATLFMLLTLIAYLYWRRSIGVGQYRLAGLLPVIVFLVLGLFAKENAALVLPVILLVEALWLQFRDTQGRRLPTLQRVTLALIVCGAAAALLLLFFSIDYLEYRHRRRPFSLGERVLTQGRVLWDYIAQWFVPQVQRMGLYHDDLAWSESFLQPISTLWAWLAWLWVALLGALLLRWPAARLFLLGMGWYLAGHVMESTVWPLELYFEHRNYFPSLGLLLLIAACCVWVIQRWRETGPPLLCLLAVWPLVLALMTSSQVQIWSSRPLLIAQHLNGHPNSERANTDMASRMARLGSAEKALLYSRRAAQSSHVERAGDWAVRDLALLCIARGEISSAQIQRIGRQDSARPLSSVTTLLTLVRMVQDNECPTMPTQQFSDHLAGLYLHGDTAATASTNMYSNMAVLENALQHYDRAFAYTEKLLARKPRHKRGLLMQLHFATALGKQEVAAELVNTLQGMGRDGKLTIAERQTLELYLEN